MSIYLSMSLSLSLYIYIHIHICIHTHTLAEGEAAAILFAAGVDLAAGRAEGLEAAGAPAFSALLYIYIYI